VARIAALVPDLMFGSKIEATLRAAGHDVELAPSADAIATGKGSPDLVIADLGEVDVSQLQRRNAPVLGFYSHVDVDTRRRAEAEGVDLVVPRSRMAREMPQLVESLLGDSPG
jgi:hypothetical protein